MAWYLIKHMIRLHGVVFRYKHRDKFTLSVIVGKEREIVLLFLLF